MSRRLRRAVPVGVGRAPAGTEVQGGNNRCASAPASVTRSSVVFAALLIALALPVPAAGAITPAQLGVVVNVEDPLSRRLGELYLEARRIPRENLIEVSLPPEHGSIKRERFAEARRRARAASPPGIQAYALLWARPFKVECMSMTTAFAAGFDEDWCATPCETTRRSLYFDSVSTTPADDLDLYPSMLLAALSEEHGRALIERGVAADGTRPRGVGYLVQTSDRRRNVRAPAFPALVEHWRDRFELRFVRADAIEGRGDVMFYFTGAPHVPAIDTNEFRAGAVADHLTSGGGRLVGGRQMSALRWLEAGATASYGTVVEPCAFPQKFPAPGVLLRHYLAGETVLEAYWKSVMMPGQGVFVGEPLARPFAALAPHGPRDL